MVACTVALSWLSLDLPSQGVVIIVSPAAAVFLAIVVVAMLLVKRHGRHKRNTTRTDTALAKMCSSIYPRNLKYSLLCFHRIST